MNEIKHLIIVDDDKDIRELVSDFLTKHGYKMSAAENAQHLFTLLKKNEPTHLLILDLMMPGIDGLEICKQLRQKQNNIPIIMLTGINDTTDRIIGLELGADDYLPKPFNPHELLARIKTVLRRSHENSNDIQPTNHIAIPCTKSFYFNGWSLHPHRRQLISPENIEVSISSRTYDLLLVFLEHPQHILSRDQLLTILSNRMADNFDRSIDVQVSRLRQKLGDDPKDPTLIKTIRSGGYFFAAKVEKA